MNFQRNQNKKDRVRTYCRPASEQKKPKQPPRFLIIFLFINVILCGVLHAQTYLWPTNASEYMSASFCEFREGHYHSAIDIKTWNTEGYPCYAVEDGYVKRIRVSPFGYGKVIYVQLKDGNTAVYAHLQKFSAEIDQKVRDMQFENHKYSIDWWPANLKVKKGEIIAFTGRTGIGVPHLHFEIRNPQGNPVNPLQYYTQIRDHVRPQLQELAVIPLKGGTLINGSHLPQRFSLTPIKNGVYVYKRPIYVKGAVGLAIRGYDQADEVHNRYGFYRSVLEANGQKVFELVYNELEFETTEHIYSEIYFQWWADLRDRFNKLFLESFNPLPFYNRSLQSDGSLVVDDKPLGFQITISDFYNNQSIVSGELLSDEATSMHISYAGKQGAWAYVEFTSPPIRALSFFSKDYNKKWQAAEYFEIQEKLNHNPQQTLRVKIALQDSNARRLKISVNNRFEQVVPLSTPRLSDNTNYQIHAQGKNLIIEFPDIDTRPFIRLEPQNIPLDFTRVPGKGIEVFIPGRLISGIPSILSLSGDVDEITLPVLDYQWLLPDQPHTVSFDDSALVLNSFEGSVMDTVLLTVQPPDTNFVFSASPQASQIYQLGPDNFPIFRPLTVRITADSLPDWGRWSLYRINGRDRLSFLSSRIDTLHGILSARTTALGKFVIASDTTRPWIHIISPRQNAVYTGTPAIRLEIKDQISGIGDEKHISLLMDGDFVLSEWDPEEDTVTGLLKEKPGPGVHDFEVRVQDRAGNLASQSVSFEIK